MFSEEKKSSWHSKTHSRKHF